MFPAISIGTYWHEFECNLGNTCNCTEPCIRRKSNDASVRMRSEAYGSYFVCVCVCVLILLKNSRSPVYTCI